jgi:hypothetical protein
MMFDWIRRFIEELKKDPYTDGKYDRYLSDGTKVRAGVICKSCKATLFDKETGEYEKCFFCGDNVVGNGESACYDVAGMKYHVCGKCVIEKYKSGRLQPVKDDSDAK